MRSAFGGAAVVVAHLLAAGPAIAQSAPSSEAELRAQVRALTEQVQRLTTMVEQLQKKTEQVDEKTEALATQQEAAGARPVPGGAGPVGRVPGIATGSTAAVPGSATAGATANPPASAAADAALLPSSLGGAVGQVSVFGYGEINYNRPHRDPSQSQVTVRRAVLGFGYRFSDRLRMVSEFEWENAVVSASDPGEVEVEQLYLDYGHSARLNVKAGLFLMPIGLLNDMHEPTRYYGVERNDVETRVIPTTWREVGVGVYGYLDNGLYYDVGVTSGFNMSKWDAVEGPAAPLATIHGEGAQAAAGSGAVYAALRYNVPGLRLGTGVWSGSSAQRNGAFKAGDTALDLSGLRGRVTLWDVHAVWQPGRWDLRALYARGTIGNAGAINDALSAPAVGQTGGFVPSSFDGWYLQAAYDAWRSGDFSLKPFARWERYNLQRGMPAAYASFRDPLLNERVITVGASLFVTRNAVIKTDYQWYQADARRSRLNVGLGYAF